MNSRTFSLRFQAMKGKEIKALSGQLFLITKERSLGGSKRVLSLCISCIRTEHLCRTSVYKGGIEVEIPSISRSRTRHDNQKEVSFDLKWPFSRIFYFRTKTRGKLVTKPPRCRIIGGSAYEPRVHLCQQMKAVINREFPAILYKSFPSPVWGVLPCRSSP